MLDVKPEPTQLLTIGELSRRTGVAPSALRFYEARGLIQAERTASGHRRYPRAVARRVAFILFGQRLGFTLEELRAELDRLPADRVPTGGDWERLSRVWDARIAERIEELERLRGSLSDCIGCGCLSLERCAILNPEDRVARQGPGPRYWIGDRRVRPDGGAAAEGRAASKGGCRGGSSGEATSLRPPRARRLRKPRPGS
ncbi:MAG TPA: redox-sensitive transcriptional activator SoxR [Longimicrobiales bacterium]